jgi:hypothetical protein
LRVFAEHLFDTGVYRPEGRRTRKGEAVPAASSFLYRWLKEAEEIGLL